MSNYDLTTGDDVIDFGTTSGNTVTATDGALTSGDRINAGAGANALILSGAGAFDLAAPVFFTGVTDVEEEDSGQTVNLRAGLPVSVRLAAGAGGETVTLANIGDSFDGGSSSGNTVYATAAQAEQDVLNAGAPGGNSQLSVTTGGQLVSLASGRVANFEFVSLEGAGVTFDPAAAGVAAVFIRSGGETVTLNATTTVAVDTTGGNTVLFAGAADRLDLEPPVLAGMTPPPAVETLLEFASGDSVTIGGLSHAAGATATFDAASDTVTVSGTDAGGGAVTDVFQLRGAYVDAFTLAAVAGSATAYALTYGLAAPSSTQVLTAGDDTVSAGISLVIATDATLTSGDDINPDFGATLELSGAGTFDLTQPQTLTGVGAIQVDAPGAVVTLRAGLSASLALSASGGDTVTLADDGVSVDASGGANDVFNVNADQAANATINGGPFSTLNITPGAPSAVVIGPTVTGIQYLGLSGAGASLDPGASGASLIYVYGGAGGGDTVVLNAVTKAAIDDATAPAAADNYFFTPGGGQTLTVQYAGAPAQNLYGFDGAGRVVLPGFATAAVSSAADTVDGAAGTLVTVAGTNASGGSVTQRLQLFGAYSNAFALTPVGGGPGFTLSYGGLAPNNTLTGGLDAIVLASDVYAATNTITGLDVVTTTNGTMHLIGAGSFQFNDGAVFLGLATIDAQDQNQSIALASGAVTVNIQSAGREFIQNLTGQTVVKGGASGNNEGRASSQYVDSLSVDLGSAGHNFVDIQDGGYALTLNAPNVKHVQTFSIHGHSGIMLDTGTYKATSGQAVEISIADDTADAGGADTILLRGAGEQVTDFFGGNSFSLLAQGQTINADMNGAPKPVETVTGFNQSDTINLPFLTALTAKPTVSGGATTLLLTGTQLGGAAYSQTFLLNGLSGGTFKVTPSAVFSDGFGVTYIPCYAEGTRVAVLGPDGAPREVPVEAVRAGDAVVLHAGGTRPVVWTGGRTIDVTRHPDPDAVAPIRIAANAISPGRPRRDLVVSPDHAVLVDGALIPARLLLNGVSVTRLNVASVRYIHIELDAHDLMLAEGLPAESYLDTGNRAAFEGSAVVALHPDFSPAARAGGLPVAIDAETVRPVWKRLAARAGAGLAKPREAASEAPILVVDGRCVRPMPLGPDRVAYALPSGARSARLVCAAARPADSRPWLDDRRRLGVAVSRLEADGELLPLDGPALGEGWHAAERDGARRWRWTDGDAAIAIPPGASLLTVTTGCSRAGRQAAA